MDGVVQSWVTAQARIGAAPDVTGVPGCAVNWATGSESFGKPSKSEIVNRTAEMADGPAGSLDTHRPPGGT
jgi:hypothetical protein